MSDVDALHNRGRSLENAFFTSLDQKLLDGMREKLNLENAITQFRQVTGIEDAKVLEALYFLGVTPPTLAAMRVFPMIAVAWADGTTDDVERLTIRTIAEQHILPDSAAANLLKRWLSEQPTEAMFEAWETYADAMLKSLPPSEAASLKATLTEELNEVATASGGVLGWGSISMSERNTLARIKKVLE